MSAPIVSDTTTVDVLVVGGGPVGMTAAGDLARLGRSVAVLERWPAINPASRAFAVMPSTLEVLDSRGLADDLLAIGATTPAVNLYGGSRIDLTRVDSAYRFAMITPQTNVDQALTRYAVAQGAAVHRGIELVALDQDASGVTAMAHPKDDDDPAARTVWRARYLVAADGAHSTVRDLLGVDFPGRAVLSSAVLADVRITAPPTGEGLSLGNTRDTFGFLVPYGRVEPDGSAWFRSMTWDRHHQVPDSEPVGEDEVVDVLDRSMGRDVGVTEIGWHSRFHCEERQVAQYRHGRVFLAGDAAHVHSPVGGQGMNTGIQDAANLAWKLDTALTGAGDDVLDSYHRERHPIGRLVVRQSGLLMRSVIVHARPARWLRDLLSPLVFGIPAVRDTLAGRFTGVALRYPRSPGDAAEVGARAFSVPLAEGRLSQLLRTPGFVLVRERDAQPLESVEVHQARRTDDGPGLLVRPDGYVAWAGDTSSEGWRTVLARWTPAGGARSVPVRSAKPPGHATVALRAART